MKEIVLSCHAKRRIQLYEITLQDVEQTLNNPDRVVSSIKGRYNAYRRVGERFLRVIYKEDGDSYLIITVTPRESFREI